MKLKDSANNRELIAYKSISIFGVITRIYFTSKVKKEKIWMEIFQTDFKMLLG